MKLVSQLLVFVLLLVSASKATSENVYFHFVWRDQSVDHVLELTKVLSASGFSGLTIGLTKSLCLDYDQWDCVGSVNSQSDLKKVIKEIEKKNYIKGKPKLIRIND